jgi:feruloyl-CoA synthase
MPEKAGRPTHVPDGLFATPRPVVERKADGSTRVRAADALKPIGRSVTDWLAHWAAKAPDRVFLQERESAVPGAPWRKLSYAETFTQIEKLAAGLLSLGLGEERPLAILNDNSIDHARLTLAALHVGIPVTPISPAYSLQSRDHLKLRAILRALSPGAVFAPDIGLFGPALAAAKTEIGEIPIIAAKNSNGAIGIDLLATRGDPSSVARANAAIGPETIAKILFTSGSTGDPKGVVNLQRMLLAGQQAKVQVWPFLEYEPPVFLDWLPWSHTFGGNHNFNMALRNGGTLIIDNGKPAPGLFQRTIDNIRDTRSNIYFNVPRGFDMLVAELKKDSALREVFFERLQVIFYAGAALPQNLWDDLIALSRQTIGAPVVMVSAWGSTETAPLATDCHFQAERSGVIGVPVPGVELKLVPNGDKEEIRVRGPNVTPGYWKRPDLTAKAFDSEGFYLIGDAVRWLDPTRPEQGLLFDGRVVEDFKLMSGTFVNVTGVRLHGVQCLAPIAQDIVVTGHDREEIGFLVYTNLAAARALADLPDDAPAESIVSHPAVVAHIRAGLAKMKAAGGGSASHASRALLMTEAPSVDAGEITDKGYINQRASLTRRAALVDKLYSADSAVITV